jgi:hypothetical protein
MPITGSAGDSERMDEEFYPSKLFSMADYYMPDSIKEIFQFCKYLALSDPIISGAIHKLAEAPVTEVVYEHDNEEVKQRYKTLFEQNMNVREKFLEAGFDLATYSNAFLSFEVDVDRYLISPNLAENSEDFKKDARKVNKGQMDKFAFDMKYDDQLNMQQGSYPRRYKAENINWELTGDGRFRGQCPKTGKQVIFERQDRYYPSAENVSIKKWNPNQMEIHHNEVTGRNRYYYDLQHSTKQLIKDGDRRHYNNDPWEYIQAARNNRNVRIKRDQLYHLSNVKISGAFNGWGVPRLYSAFKLIFYYMTLLRSNEQVARGKIQDLNILFPQSQSGMLDPVAAVPGSNFKQNVKGIVKEWRKDKNFLGISPIPVGNLSVFGDGRMQLVSSELQPIIRMITTAMGLPYEMLYGGGKYSGMAVQQRLFSAQTGLHAQRFNEALDFFQQKASSMLGTDQYPRSMNMKLKEYEGPDDTQKKQMRAKAAMNNQLSISTFWEDQGLDPEQEWKRMEDDAEKMANVQEKRAEGKAKAKADAQEIVQRSKMNLKEEMAEQKQEAKAESQSGGKTKEDLKQLVKEMMKHIKENPGEKQKVLKYAKAKHPKAFQILKQQLQKSSGQMPDAEMPTLDSRSQQQGSPQQGGNQQAQESVGSGVNVGMPSDSPQQSSGQNKETIQMDDSQPEQKPPQRNSGGL